MIADAQPVRWIADRLAALWGEGAAWVTTAGEPQPHEAHSSFGSTAAKAPRKAGLAPSLGPRRSASPYRRLAAPRPGTRALTWPTSPSIKSARAKAPWRTPESPRMDADLLSLDTVVESLRSSRDAERLREAILDLASLYAKIRHSPVPFVAGVSPVPVSGKVCGPEDMRTLVDSSLDFWLATGRFNDAFEESAPSVHRLASRHDPQLRFVRQSPGAIVPDLAHAQEAGGLKPGDEVIAAVATGFPTTVNPTLQYGLVPVFVDVDIPTYNAKPEMIEAAVGDRTRAIMLAHTLGNPFDLAEVMRVGQEALNCGWWRTAATPWTTYDGRMKSRHVRRHRHRQLLQFPPITSPCGEGGARCSPTRSSCAGSLESMRDWGRDCWCAPGKDNTCEMRFTPADGRAAVRLRPQVHLQPRRL